MAMRHAPRSTLLTRRAAMRAILSGAGVLLLAACAPAAPQAPAKPTEAPKPAAAPTQAAPATAAPAAKPAAEASKPAAPAQPTAPAAAKPDAKPAGQPKTGGKLRTATAVDLDAAGVDGSRLGPAYTPTMFMVFDTLTAYDDKRQPQPMLAESWDFSADAKQIKLNLRKGVTWHSGREFTSEDVKYNMIRVRDPKLGSAQLATFSNWFKEIETPDKNSIILKSDQPRPILFDMLEYFNMVDKDLADGPDAKVKAGGTGPFSLVEWIQGDHLLYAKNKNYWQSGKPYLDEIHVSLMKDAQAMAVQFEAGTIDAMMNPSVQDGARLQKDSKYQVSQASPNGIVMYMSINTTVAPLDNKKVRQAISFAIDRQRFAETVLLKMSGEPRSLPWPPGSIGEEASKNNFFAFNLDKAKSLLAEAGVSNLELDLMYSNVSPELAALAQIIGADVAKIGGKLTLKPIELAVYNENLRTRKYNLGTSNFSFAQMEPGTLVPLSGGYRVNDNGPGFKSERYGQLVAQTQTETDLTKRKAAISQLNDLLLDEAFALPIVSQPWFMVAKSNLKNIKWRVNMAPMYGEMWLE